MRRRKKKNQGSMAVDENISPKSVEACETACVCMHLWLFIYLEYCDSETCPWGETTRSITD